MRKKIYDEAMGEMERAFKQMNEDLGDPPSDEVPSAADLIAHMKWWFAEQLSEEDRINRASFFACYGPERPQ